MKRVMESEVLVKTFMEKWHTGVEETVEMFQSTESPISKCKL